MITIIVSKESWAKCFNRTYINHGSRMGSKTKEYLCDAYGIEHWHKINLDEYQLKFNDEKKMIYWMLRWS